MYRNTTKALEIIFNRTYNEQNPIESLQHLVTAKYLSTIQKNRTIIYQEDPVDYFYILLSGKVSVVNSVWGYDIVIDYIEPIHILGLVEYLNNIKTYTAFVMAETTCTLFKIPVNEFTNIIQNDSSLCYQTLVSLGEATQANMNSSEIKSMVHPRDILGNHLFHLAAAGGTPYTFPDTRSSLAEFLHINLRTLYRYIEYLEKEGYLALRRGKIVIEKQHFEKLLSRYNELIL